MRSGPLFDNAGPTFPAASRVVAFNGPAELAPVLAKPDGFRYAATDDLSVRSLALSVSEDMAAREPFASTTP